MVGKPDSHVQKIPGCVWQDMCKLEKSEQWFLLLTSPILVAN
jgi:hypothetical protein